MVHVGRFLNGMLAAAVITAPAMADNTIALGQMSITDKEILADQLESEIKNLDYELQRCQRSKKIWTATTIVGATGTVAAGIGAGIQAHKLKQVGISTTTKSESDTNEKTDAQTE